MTTIAGAGTRCPGFRFAGVRGGIKKKDGRDLGLIVCDTDASVGAVFTQNRVRAAPVRLSERHLTASKRTARAIVVNSGNANACTGPVGDRDARTMASQTGKLVGAKTDRVLVASTGVIGQPLPMPAVSKGIAAAVAALREDGFADFAEAIMTTDRRPKTAARTVKVGKDTITLVGCTKGAGMIMPNMATTLTYVTTDAAIAPVLLQRLVVQAAAGTYNAIAVDGDTSTNDMLAVLASGRTGAKIASASSKPGALVAAALTDLLADLSTQLMGDGEGVHHVVGIEVTGARSDRDALTVARRIAISPLVKTAIAGGDPNWGRILCAAGNAGVPLTPDRITLSIAGLPVVARGAAHPRLVDSAVATAMLEPRYDIVLGLGAGTGRARYLACDLSHEYVSINADYRS